jgi:hypothetical protein
VCRSLRAFRVDPTGLRPDGTRDDHQVITSGEHTPRDEGLRANEATDSGRNVGVDDAGEVELELAQYLRKPLALDEDQLRMGRQPCDDELCELLRGRFELFSIDVEIENGNRNRRIICGRRRRQRHPRQQDDYKQRSGTRPDHLVSTHRLIPLLMDTRRAASCGMKW